MINPFRSAPPQVTLINCFERPYDNAIATARTCYSSNGIVTAEQVAEKPLLRDNIAESIYQAGHHTTLQHAHVQFGLSNISRQFIWSFLHSHFFYNSEQVSQRYVKTDTSGILVPQLEGEALQIYLHTIEQQANAYRELNKLLRPTVRGFYYDIFPARQPAQGKAHPIAKRTIPKKAMEIGRYVLPVGTFAYLYHTISVITLLRYYRLCQQFDVPTETHYVVSEMVRLLLEYDPLFATILEEPLPLEETLEYRYFANMSPRPASRAFIQEFDESLEGYTSKLISYKLDNEALLASSVREVLGLARSEMSDADAIGLVLDPRQNRYFGESMNVTTLSKLTRTMVHPHYTFRKKLSHTADSQDQRHRMTPASRPTLRAYLSDEPDYITPSLLSHNDLARQRYDDSMNDTWSAIRKLRALGVEDEMAAYLLPNAVAIRFTESGDLLAMHHKLRMRLCYNAQEEIFAASKDEALQIQQANPQIGQYLGAPCTLRHASQTSPFCPEGERYCGVPVWKIPIKEYERVL